VRLRVQRSLCRSADSLKQDQVTGGTGITNMSQWTAHPAESTPASHHTQLKEAAASFKLLSDETRLRVLSLLIQHGELNVRSLCEQLDQSQPAVSHHLALLRDAGLIRARRDGKHNYYRCIPEKMDSFMDFAWRNVMAPEREAAPVIPSC
jgi:DNA-binding transcriptional ArsR family regulator